MYIKTLLGPIFKVETMPDTEEEHSQESEVDILMGKEEKIDGRANKEEKTYCRGLVKKRTLLVIWGTISITLTNFGYFSLGWYLFNYFQVDYFERELNNSVVILEEQKSLFAKYPTLQNSSKLENYTRTAELLCHITNYPRNRWSFWAAFDFCVSIITTVGYGVLHPTTWYSKVVCVIYSCFGLPLYILMLGAAGSYIVSMFEYMNEKSSFVQTVCKHKYTELIIAYVNIAIIMTLFLFGYSYFGYSASRKSFIYTNMSVIELEGYDFNYTRDTISVGASNWTQTDSFYYSMISLTTVGFGDYYLGRPNDPKQAAMLFASVTFGFALFSYAFQTYAKLSEATIKYMQEKGEAATKAAASAAVGELGDLASNMGGKLSALGSHTSLDEGRV